MPARTAKGDRIRRRLASPAVGLVVGVGVTVAVGVGVGVGVAVAVAVGVGVAVVVAVPVGVGVEVAVSVGPGVGVAVAVAVGVLVAVAVGVAVLVAVAVGVGVGVGVGPGVDVRVTVVVPTTTPLKIQNAVALVASLSLLADRPMVRWVSGPPSVQSVDQTTEMRLLPLTTEGLLSVHLCGLLVTTALPTLLAPAITKQTSFTGAKLLG